jgi:hypothetical protein
VRLTRPSRANSDPPSLRQAHCRQYQSGHQAGLRAQLVDLQMTFLG